MCYITGAEYNGERARIRSMPYRGHVENGRVVLDDPAPLPEGAAVTVEPAKARSDALTQALLDPACTTGTRITAVTC